MIAFIHLPEGVQKSGPVLVGLEHRFLLISTEGEVISSAGLLSAKRAGHIGKTVARKEANVNSKDLTLRSDCPDYRRDSSMGQGASR